MKVIFPKDLVMFKWGKLEIFTSKKDMTAFQKRMETIGDLLDKYGLNNIYQDELNSRKK